MRVETYLVGIVTFVAALMLTGAVRNYTLARGILDVPNKRSSHATPTPRGGGIAIVAASLVAACCLVLLDSVSFRLFMAIVGGGIAVATVGFLDDRSSLPARVRLMVHFGVAFWALGWLGGFPPIEIGAHRELPSVLGDGLAAVGIVAFLNLFNFMDGIDGIAASEAVFIVWAGAALAIASAAGTAAWVPFALILGAAVLGFLAWNWPPARIFMGDVGSGYLGYAIAVLALAALRQSIHAAWVWLILGGVFVVDATVTLLRRLFRGEPVYEAHRSHAYQRLARSWRGHKPVTLAVITCNMVWLLPCAFFAAVHPERAMWIATGALVPLIVVALAAGAGNGE